MICMLIKKKTESISFWARLWRRLFFPAVAIEEQERDGVVLRVIFCNPYRRIHWGKIAGVVGDDDIFVAATGLEPPEWCGLTIFDHSSTDKALARRAALDVLKAARPDPKACKILLYDRRGRFLELAERLSELCNEMMVVTNELERYGELEDEILARTGKPILLSNEMPDNRYRVIVAPAGFDRVVRTDPGTIVFMCGEQNHPQNGVVYYRYFPDIPEAWRTLCPEGVDYELFCAALYTVGQEAHLFDAPPVGYRRRICVDSFEKVREMLC